MEHPTPPAPTAADTVDQVVRHCREEQLLEPGDRVVVAVSGGADSVALASILREARERGLPLELVLAHVDHGWRGPEEARLDREVVQALAARLGVPLELFPPPAAAARTEDAARRWRYSRLEESARRHGCRKVATGHHLRDQAETFLLRLLRGSGTVGLTGIPAKRSLGTAGLEVVRPLLRTDPARLREHVASRGLAWREDPTNLDPAHDRVRARARLLALDARGGAATRRLADLAERLRRRVEARRIQVEERLASDLVHHRLAEAVEVPRALLAGLPLHLVELSLRAMGAPLHADVDGPWFTRAHLRRIAELLEVEGEIELPRSLLVTVRGGRVLLARRWIPAEPTPPPLAREDVPADGFDLAAFLANRRTDGATVDADALGPAATVRLLRKGDRFTPLGADAAVDVVEWLSKRGVPALVRRGVLVVEGAHGIAWVVGHRIDAAHAVRPSTTRVAILTLGRPGSAGGSAPSGRP